MPEDNERALMISQLRHIAERFGRYHNHKENAAWAGVVLYLALVAGVLRIPPAQHGVGALLITLFLAFAGGIVCYYVSIQNGLRKEGFLVAAACDRLIAWVASERIRVTKDHWKPGLIAREPKEGFENAFRFPILLTRMVGKLRKRAPRMRKGLLNVPYVIVGGAFLFACLVLAPSYPGSRTGLSGYTLRCDVRGPGIRVSAFYCETPGVADDSTKTR